MPEYEYKDFTKCFTITLTADSTPNNIGVQLDKDADFFWEGVQATYTQQPYAATFFDHTQYALSNAPLGSYSFASAVVGCAPPRLILPSLFFPAGSAIIMNLVELSGSDNGPIQFLFRGTKRYIKKPNAVMRGR